MNAFPSQYCSDLERPLAERPRTGQTAAGGQPGREKQNRAGMAGSPQRPLGFSDPHGVQGEMLGLFLHGEFRRQPALSLS
jgi:hypothetical protein